MASNVTRSKLSPLGTHPSQKSLGHNSSQWHNQIYNALSHSEQPLSGSCNEIGNRKHPCLQRHRKVITWPVEYLLVLMYLQELIYIAPCKRQFKWHPHKST